MIGLACRFGLAKNKSIARERLWCWLDWPIAVPSPSTFLTVGVYFQTSVGGSAFPISCRRIKTQEFFDESFLFDSCSMHCSERGCSC